MDYPWAFQNWTSKKNGAAVAHYEGMPLEDGEKIPVGQWGAKNSILLMWATWPKLEDAFRLARAWGWRDYVTGAPWVKTVPDQGTIKTGIGFWWQSASEILLVFRRGKVSARRHPVIALIQGHERQFYCPHTRQHSKKPDDVQAWVEAKVEGPYLELFATRQRPGWTCWGRNLGTELGPFGVREV